MQCVMLLSRGEQGYDERTYCGLCGKSPRESDCRKTDEYFLGPDGRCVNQFGLVPGVEYIRVQDFLDTHPPAEMTQLCDAPTLSSARRPAATAT